jgi:8-amino-7-oxononanoate synthase
MTSFEKLNKAPSRLISQQNQDCLYFGGTSYLGINHNEHFRDLYLKGLQELGLNNGTSRSNNVQLAIYNEAEKEASSRFYSEASLITSSGFLAAQLVVRHFLSFGEVIYAPNCHPALWLNNKPDVQGNFKEWIVNTIHYINQSKSKRFVIISDALNNLKPEIHDFSSLQEIQGDKEIVLIADDSHGLGVIGEKGVGVYSELPSSKNIVRIVVASMAKGLGIDAGIVLSDAKTIDSLKRTGVFLGASPPAPALLHAFVNAKDIYHDEWKKLYTNMLSMEEMIPEGFVFAKGFPVYYTERLGLYNQLLSKDIVISSFPYPQANYPLLNRIIVSSWHRKEDLQYLVNQLDKIYIL